MAPHSSTLAWKIPWMEEPGRLQSMGSLGVGHDWATSISLFTFIHWRRKWQPTPVFLPRESQGRGSLVGCRPWVAQSRTRLKRLSSSSKHHILQIIKDNFNILPYTIWRERNTWGNVSKNTAGNFLHVLYATSSWPMSPEFLSLIKAAIMVTPCLKLSRSFCSSWKKRK